MMYEIFSSDLPLDLNLNRYGTSVANESFMTVADADEIYEDLLKRNFNEDTREINYKKKWTRKDCSR